MTNANNRTAVILIIKSGYQTILLVGERAMQVVSAN
jgi:hypothetical protein